MSWFLLWVAGVREKGLYFWEHKEFKEFILEINITNAKLRIFKNAHYYEYPILINNETTIQILP